MCKLRNRIFMGVLITFVAICSSCDMISNAVNKDNSNNGVEETPSGGDTGISWTSEANGTLKIANNTTKDMVIFQGQTPSVNTIIGGIRAGTNRFFDISDDVDDFSTGGYIILRGMDYDIYQENKGNLSSAKVEYSAMATYGQGKKFSSEINPAYTGDYYFKVTNLGRIGMELRKDSPDGEKLGYLPSLATNYTLYANSSDGFSIFPVFVYYNKSTGTVTSVKASSHFESVTVGPRPVTDTAVVGIELPAAGIQWEDIVGSLTSPVAYITCTNNVTNQGAYFTLAGTTKLKGQNGYDLLNAGEVNTFEVSATDEGLEKQLIVTLYNGAIKVPVRDKSGSQILIKNGYDYTVSVNFDGSDVQNASAYSAVIEEVSKRDISDEIESL